MLHNSAWSYFTFEKRTRELQGVVKSFYLQLKQLLLKNDHKTVLPTSHIIDQACYVIQTYYIMELDPRQTALRETN